MKWDPDKSIALLEKWTGVTGRVTFVKRHMPAQILREFGFAKEAEGGAGPIWELSVATLDGSRYFFGRTSHEAFLVARKALRPKRRRKKKDDRH